MKPDDITLQRAIEGDVQAFEALVELYQHRVYGVCLRMLCNDQDAQDAAQETFIKVYRSIGSFKQQAQFSTWIYRIAVNTSLDYLRRRRVTASFDAMVEEGFDAPSDADTGDRALEKQFEREQIDAAIASLPEDQRAVIVLRDVQGLSYEEVAGAVQTNLNTVKSRISRGRRALRKLLYAGGELFSQPCVKKSERSV